MKSINKFKSRASPNPIQSTQIRVPVTDGFISETLVFTLYSAPEVITQKQFHILNLCTAIYFFSEALVGGKLTKKHHNLPIPTLSPFFIAIIEALEYQNYSFKTISKSSLTNSKEEFKGVGLSSEIFKFCTGYSVQECVSLFMECTDISREDITEFCSSIHAHIFDESVVLHEEFQNVVNVDEHSLIGCKQQLINISKYSAFQHGLCAATEILIKILTNTQDHDGVSQEGDEMRMSPVTNIFANYFSFNAIQTTLPFIDSQLQKLCRLYRTSTTLAPTSDESNTKKCSISCDGGCFTDVNDEFIKHELGNHFEFLVDTIPIDTEAEDLRIIIFSITANIRGVLNAISKYNDKTQLFSN